MSAHNLFISDDHGPRNENEARTVQCTIDLAGAVNALGPKYGYSAVMGALLSVVMHVAHQNNDCANVAKSLQLLIDNLNNPQRIAGASPQAGSA